MYHDTQGREIEDLEGDNMKRDRDREEAHHGGETTTAPFTDDSLGPLSMTDVVVRGNMGLEDQAINELDALVVTRADGNPKMLTVSKVSDWVERWTPVLGKGLVTKLYMIVSKSPKRLDVATVRARRPA